MIILKKSTSVTLLIGPFVDSSDGDTVMDSLTIAQADVRVSKNGGNMAQKNESTSCTHDELGYYTCPLDSTDTNTLGQLKIMVHKSGALPVWVDCLVVTANVYDTFCSTDKFDVDADGVQKNTALSNFPVVMVLTSDHVTPATGKTVTGEVSLDAGAFASVSGSIAEVSDGLYQFDADAADTNGDIVVWKFSATGCDDTWVHIKTES